ncbi:hypothetical protein [Polycladidibacter hongkongensis]|uniref:hypothetical protein n=1 Tax=Polycladidibacter hongkongensis TaxID=1647556 RepID=UPI000832CC7F|nr:hypothetical protein [Pseudovibrio hongkongensis]
MTKNLSVDSSSCSEEEIDLAQRSIEGEIDQIGKTLPSLKAQLVKWVIRSFIAFGLAKSYSIWASGPDWLMPVTYAYIGLSLLLALFVWYKSQRLINESKQSINKKAEHLRSTLTEPSSNAGDGVQD